MLIYLLAPAVAIIAFSFGFMFRENHWGREKFLIYLFRTLFVFTVAPIVIHAVAFSVSYDTYIDARTQYDAVINQYRGAVKVYADYADLDMAKASFTDFKHQGYQENISTIIKDLRAQIVTYNETIISKRIMDRNPLFSWLIYEPDEDMKIINIIEEGVKK